MRLCTNCNKLTSGDPLFCMHCGRTYGVRLCPSRHINPRSATVCSECGSTELSMPAPSGKGWVVLLFQLAWLIVGVLLLLLAVLVFLALIRALLVFHQLTSDVFLAGLVVSLLWLAY